MRVVYLTGERVYLRAMVAGDKNTAAAWFPGPFPINATQAETWLRETHSNIGRGHNPRYLVIARIDDDAPVGGVALAAPSNHHGFLRFAMAPWLNEADALRAEALRLLIPWIRNDLELMTLGLYIAADETVTRAAAEELGMRATARLRGFVARPDSRVDRLLYQALNAPWRVADA